MIASRRVPLRRRLRLRLPRPGPRTLGALVAVLVLLGGGWVWLRDSSLVAVHAVRITGVNGPDAGRIRAALRNAALNMTTLDVKMDQLRTAVQPYPVVKRLNVGTQFPHGMTIGVLEQVPVATILVAGRRTAVSADGTLLSSITPTGALPTIALRVPPGGTRLTGGARDEVRLLAAAPYGLLARVATVSAGAHGLTAGLRNGPSLYFGSSAGLREKWSAAVAVLAGSGSAGASYIDVTVPARPAAGAGTDSNAAATVTAAGTTAAGSGSTSGASSGSTLGAGSGSTPSGTATAQASTSG